MWTPAPLWNRLADGFEHWKFEQVSNYKSGPKNLKIVHIKVEEGVDLGFGIKDFLLPNVVL